MDAEFHVDADLFWERLGKLHSSWQDARGKDALWKGADAIVIDTGKYDEDAMYLRSTSLHNWLFGLEMPDTVIVVTETMLYVLGSAKKVAIIEPLQSKRPSDAKLSVLCYTRSKADKDASNYATLVEKVKGSHDGRAVAMLLKEEPKGDPAERWRTALRGATAEQLDLGPMVGELLARKDAAEQTLVKRAALFSAKLLEEYVVGEIENLVDRKIDKPHSDLATKIEDVIGSDTLLSQLKIPPNKIPDPNNLDTAYTPIIQSGGVFNLKPSAESTDDPLHHGDGVITVSLGGRYRAYCANIGRTYVINPTKAQAAEYATLLAAHEAAVGALKPGRPASDALQAAVDAVRGRDPALVPKLTKNVGFATGLEFRDASFVLNAKNTRSVEEGMVFNVALGLENLENPRAKSAKERAYAMFLAETVLVGEGGAEVLTTGCTRAWAQVSYQIADEDEGPAAGESRGKENKPKPPGKSSASKVELTHSRTRGKNQQQAAAQLDEQLREHQKELEESITRDALRRLERGGEGGRGGGAKSSALAVPTAYPSHDALPRDLKYTQTVVDAKANAVLIPIFGTVVPFHITTIKNVTRSEEGQFTYLRINFNPPGQGLNTPKDAAPLIEQFKLHDCVREVTLKARDPKNLNTTHRLIKELRSRVMKENKEQDEKRGLVAQEPLRMTSGGRVNRLRDVNMRPHPSGRKSQGLLELHQNGVRYTSNKGERVDITFKNMRNCFFQPAQKEHIVLIHFHLHDGIMIGKKKHADVQFYVEVIEMSQALDQGRRGGGDGDELEEEQRERALRNRMNQEFQSFAKKLEEQSGEIEFDIPYRELGFNGLANKTSSFIMPTVNALVELIEPPWLVVNISDIEIVHFERVVFGLKNFDMVIVFKDLARDPVHLSTVEMSSLDSIKTWLDSCNIKFYEGTANLHWPAIMKTVREDPRGFYEGDSWRFLDLQAKDSDEESEESEEESEFEPSGSDEEEEDDDDEEEDDDDEDFSAEDEDDSEEGSLDSDESSGKDWDELEKEAVKHDRKRGVVEDDKARGKKRKDDDSFDDASSGSDRKPKPKKKAAPAPPLKKAKK